MNVYEGRSTVPGDVRKWSNECGAATRLWGRQAVDFDARDAAPDADTIRCTGGWMWCQACCTRPWNGRMHAGGCLDEVARAASDADAIRCTGGCLDARLLHPTPKRSDERQLMPKLLHPIAMKLDALANFSWCQDCCTWCWNHQMHWRSCLIARLLHPTVKRPDARWRLSVAKARWSDVFRDETPEVAPDAEAVGCTGDFLLCLLPGWRADKLLTDDAGEASEMEPEMLLAKLSDAREAAPDPGRSDALAIFCWCQMAAPDPGRSDALAICLFCCLLPGYRAGKLLIRSKCRLVAFDRVLADLATELGRARCWLVWDVQMKPFDALPPWKVRPSAPFPNDRQQQLNRRIAPSIFILQKSDEGYSPKNEPGQQCLWTAVRTLNAHVLDRSKQLVLTQQSWRLMPFSSKV